MIDQLRGENAKPSSIPALDYREIMVGVSAISPNVVDQSTELYNQYRAESDGAIKMGLYGDDLMNSLTDPSTIVIKATDGEKDYILPMLVPAINLEWYNLPYLREVYGEDTELLYYAHPPVADSESGRRLVSSLIEDKLRDGAIVFFDEYRDESSPREWLLDDIDGAVADSLGGGEIQRKSDIFVGTVSIKGKEGVHPAYSFSKIYSDGVANGEYVHDSDTGVAIVDVIEGDEAERIWEIYEPRFDELGQETATLAGFDKEGLIDILKDPSIAKAINRVDGKISTLCFFLDNFSNAPWFNEQYYKVNYPEHYETGNVLMFPGIVTDEKMKGNNYAQNVIDLLCEVAEKRGSEFLITFECTEISTTYIPDIVQGAITHNGLLEVTGLQSPVSIMEYKALRIE